MIILLIMDPRSKAINKLSVLLIIEILLIVFIVVLINVDQ